MIETILTQYAQPIIIIMGLIELMKRGIEKKMSRQFWIVTQILYCLLAGILVSLNGWEAGFTGILVVNILIKFLTLTSLTTLFYQFFLKKIREAGGKVKGK